MQYIKTIGSYYTILSGSAATQLLRGGKLYSRYVRCSLLIVMEKNC